MKKRRKYFVVLLLYVCIVALLGRTRERTIDKISIIHVFGFDQAENGDIIGTALIPEYTKNKAGTQIEYLEERAPSSALVISKMGTHTSTPIEIAKTRVLVFGKSYAEAGIQSMVERFIITPQIGTNIQIAVSTQSAREALNKFRKQESLTLLEQIEHNMLKQNLPNMNLHIFLNHFYGEGMDAFVPMITLDEKDTIKVDGVGVFKNDQFKLHLNPKQTTLFSILKDYRSQAAISMYLGEHKSNEIITVRAFRSKTNWDWDQKKKELNLNLRLKWTIIQHPNRFNLGKKKDIIEIKKIITKNIENGIEDLLTTLKENEVDPLGLGNIVRSMDRTWEKESFYKQYPTLPINVNVDLEIIHSGLES